MGRQRGGFMIFAGVAQLVEHQPSKLNVVGSSPITRFVMDGGHRCCRSVVVARRLGKAQVVGSIPTGSFWFWKGKP